MSNKEQLVKRVKSFAWRLGGMIAVTTLAFLLDNETIASLKDAGVAVPTAVVVVGGLVLSEITKYFNSKDITK